jgi:hypothetical protein
MFDLTYDRKSRLKNKDFSHLDYQKQLGERATVTTAIAPSQPGRVYYRATYWFAICEQDITLEVNTLVYVKERKGIILMVEPFTCDLQDCPLPNIKTASHQDNSLMAEALIGMLF